MSDANSRQRISIVVPALNEERLITPVVEGILSHLVGRFADYEVILINDGSVDATAEKMEALAAAHDKVRVIHHQTHRGLGTSYKRGVQEAKFEYLMMLCGDGGLPPKSLPAIFDKIGEADIVAPYMVNLQRIKTPLRLFTSRCYTHLLNTLFNQNVHYYNGLPVHRTDLVRQVRISGSGFAFQGEVMTKLLRAGCSLVQVGVEGAEMAQRSSALKPRNLASVFKTLLILIWDISRFDPSMIKRTGPGVES